jgi:polyketide biosynthesis enoyl-CoA hydratase PksH
MGYRAIDVSTQDSVCWVRFDRPGAQNTIDKQLVEECLDIVARCEREMTVLVLEGNADVFCFGADFRGMHGQAQQGAADEHRPDVLYDLWAQLAAGSFVSIAHVQGQANAGGLGFVAASDIVVSSTNARFSLSEMLFGIVPACVLPFLIRRVGVQKAHYLTLMTHPIDAQQALAWGLVDACAEDSRELLRKHLLRLRRLSKRAVGRYKGYLNRLHPTIQSQRELAIAENHAVFADPEVVQSIHRYVETGKFPWNP